MFTILVYFYMMDDSLLRLDRSKFWSAALGILLLSPLVPIILTLLLTRPAGCDTFQNPRPDAGDDDDAPDTGAFVDTGSSSAHGAPQPPGDRVARVARVVPHDVDGRTCGQSRVISGHLGASRGIACDRVRSIGRSRVISGDLA